MFYKPNDALANFRMAQALEKLARLDEAAECYQEYLKILPNGPQAEEAKKALEKLKASPPQKKAKLNNSSRLRCHPERNLSIRFANGKMKSKDPYSYHARLLGIFTTAESEPPIFPPE